MRIVRIWSGKRGQLAPKQVLRASQWVMQGFGPFRAPAALVARDAERWLIAGLLVMVPTGLLQFMCFANTDDAHIPSVRSRLAALISLSLWTTVAVGGRWIGFP